MSQATQVKAASGAVTPKSSRKTSSKGFFASSFSRFLGDKVSVVALIVFILITIVSYSAPIIAGQLSKPWIDGCLQNDPRDCTDFTLVTANQPPTAPGLRDHLLGTDESGRDIAVRMFYGGQVSLTVGFLTAFIAVFIGTALGLVAGFFGGWVDDLVNALFQIISNIPSLFLLIILAIIWKPDVLSISVIIGVISWTGTSRLVRGSVLSLRNRDYVDAARVMGAGNNRILLVHILPNIVSLILVQIGFDIVGAMLGEASLSFLGFGIQIPTPSWGNMLSDAQLYFQSALWWSIPPGIAIFVTVLCVYLVADGLRDAFDPRLKEKA